jgi:7-cyano-7-deazaguanine synthase
MKKVEQHPSMKKEKCLVVLSGGQDSTTCLFWAKENYKQVSTITFNYGQKHSKEVYAAYRIAEMAGISNYRLVDVPDILKSKSPLLSSNPLEQYENYDQMDAVIGDRVELTFVPLRNPFFLLVATNHAISLGITDIITGVCASDNANYPDCTEDFIIAMETMIHAAMDDNSIRILTPLINLDKKRICQLGRNLGPQCLKALAYSHTSYDGKYPPTDMNHANVLRAKGFEEAGFPDPLVIRAYTDGLMDLPTTSNYNVDQVKEIVNVLGV